MGKWGKNAVVAAVALGCALFVMGIVRLDGSRRGANAVPEQGWKPTQTEQLRQPVPIAETEQRADR